MDTEERIYRVVRIDGDYAVLRPENGTETEDFPVARALLPAEVDEGVTVGCRLFEYRIIDPEG
ncbi:MAG: hypothetical protein DBX40_00740 [Clostridiales bacterium]|nr:MAG: hypothetical protein DBX40_00740 [Clostridiales bacterium]